MDYHFFDGLTLVKNVVMNLPITSYKVWAWEHVQNHMHVMKRKNELNAQEMWINMIDKMELSLPYFNAGGEIFSKVLIGWLFWQAKQPGNQQFKNLFLFIKIRMLKLHFIYHIISYSLHVNFKLIQFKYMHIELGAWKNCK